ALILQRLIDVVSEECRNDEYATATAESSNSTAPRASISFTELTVFISHANTSSCEHDSVVGLSERRRRADRMVPAEPNGRRYPSTPVRSPHASRQPDIPA